MPVVQMPDGAQVSFPDDMPPDQIRSMILQKFPNAAQQAQQPGADLKARFGDTVGGAMQNMMESPATFGAAPAVADFVRGAGDAGGALLDRAVNAATFGLAPRAAALVGAGLSHITPGPTQTYSQALAAEQQRQQDESAAHPIASAAGTAFGSVYGGEGVVRGVGKVAAAVAPDMVKAAKAALALKAGQGARNVARLAATGAAGGAAYGGVEGAVQGAANSLDQGDVAGAPLAAAGQALTGAALGGAVGAAVGPVGAAAVRGGQAVADTFSTVSKRAITILSRRLDMTPQQVMRQMQDFKASTGRAPTIADILDAKSVANLRNIPATFQDAGAVAQKAAEQRVAALPQRLSSAVEATGPTAQLSKLRLAQNEQMNKAMDPIREAPVVVTDADVGLLADPRLASVAREDPALKQKFSDMLEHLTDADGNVVPDHAYTNFNLTDFENLRQGLRGRQRAFLDAGRPILANQYGKLADDVSSIAREQVDGYGKALDDFETQKQFIAGFEHGMAGKPLNAEGSLGDIQTLQSLAGRQGLEVGARTRLANQARSTEKGAINTADEMRQSAGLNDRLTEAMGGNSAGAIRALGKAEIKGVRNAATLAPSNVTSKLDEQARMTQQFIEGAAAAGGHVLTGFKAAFLQRMINRAHIRPSTATKLTEMLFDPAQSVSAIRTLRNARVNQQKLNQMLTNAAEASGFGAAALAAGQ